MSEEDKKAMENNLLVFKEIIDNIQGCRLANETGCKPFSCVKNEKCCKYMGDCFHVASDCIAGIAQWIVFQIEGCNTGKLGEALDKIRELTGVSEQPEEDLCIDNTDNMYL